MGEPFPDLQDRTRISCSASSCGSNLKGDAKKQTCYSNSYDIHKALHSKFGVHVQKVLHQGRREGEDNADADGVDLKDVGRMAHNIHSEQARQRSHAYTRVPALAVRARR